MRTVNFVSFCFPFLYSNTNPTHSHQESGRESSDGQTPLCITSTHLFCAFNDDRTLDGGREAPDTRTTICIIYKNSGLSAVAARERDPFAGGNECIHTHNIREPKANSKI